MASVFISYRRNDCPGHAGRLYDRIVDRLDPARVFMDIDAIPPGVDFAEYIERAIDSCAFLLVLIGDEWLDSADADGRRLDHADDPVRFEIAAALRRPGVRVIPVLVEGASMPVERALPADIQALARRHAFELRDAHWRHDVDRLLNEVAPIDSPPPRPPLGPAVVAVASVALIGLIVMFFVFRPDHGPSPAPDRTACSDRQDNDRDRMIDFPRDHGCVSANDSAERGACQDGKDNDKDGETDFPDDRGCSSLDDPAEKIAACVDGQDNDDDGRTDLRDEQCESKDDTAEAR